MTPEEFDMIRKAIEILQMNRELKRIDGDNWLVYIVGSIIRVDIKT